LNLKNLLDPNFHSFRLTLMVLSFHLYQTFHLNPKYLKSLMSLNYH
jgi:hypothetical protein